MNKQFHSNSSNSHKLLVIWLTQSCQCFHQLHKHLKALMHTILSTIFYLELRKIAPMTFFLRGFGWSMFTWTQLVVSFNWHYFKYFSKNHYQYFSLFENFSCPTLPVGVILPWLKLAQWLHSFCFKIPIWKFCNCELKF